MKANPLVMCLTNSVAADFTANALLAIGAKPAMVEEPSEAAELAMVADAVLVNLGTVHPRQAETMRAAIEAIGPLDSLQSSVFNRQSSISNRQSSVFNRQSSISNRESSISGLQHSGDGTTPWVLDPVACHQLSYRGKLAEEFIARKPTLVRGNHAEIDYLVKRIPGLENEITMLSTGEVDRILGPSDNLQSSIFNFQHSGGKVIEITGGVPMLQTVTATGCVQGAICAAMLGRGMSPFEAAMASSRLMKRAGERAWDHAHEPGSFKVALIDALHCYNSQWQG